MEVVFGLIVIVDDLIDRIGRMRFGIRGLLEVFCIHHDAESQSNESLEEK
jgi:hypothetical protein